MEWIKVSLIEKDIFLLLFLVTAAHRSKMSLEMFARNSPVSPVTFKIRSDRITRLLMKMLPS